MNALKHMEAIFVALVAVALGVSFFTTTPKPLDVAADSAVVARNDVRDVTIPVVTIAAKRLTADEKAALI